MGIASANHFGRVSPQARAVLAATQPWKVTNKPLTSGLGASYEWKPTHRHRWTASSDGSEVPEDLPMKASATLFNVGREGRMAWREVRGETKLAGGFQAAGRATAGGLQGSAGLRGDLNLLNGEAELKAMAAARAEALAIEGSLSRVIGTKSTGITPSLNGSAAILAEGTAEAALVLQPRQGTAKIGLGGDVFAGAKASASFRNEVRGFGERFGSGTIGVEGYAGACAKAKAELGFDEGCLKAKAELGVGLGLGAGIKVEVDVDVVGVGKAGWKAGKAAHGVIESAGESLGEAAFWSYYHSSRGIGRAYHRVVDWID